MKLEASTVTLCFWWIGVVTTCGVPWCWPSSTPLSSWSSATSWRDSRKGKFCINISYTDIKYTLHTNILDDWPFVWQLDMTDNPRTKYYILNLLQFLVFNAAVARMQIRSTVNSQWGTTLLSPRVTDRSLQRTRTNTCISTGTVSSLTMIPLLGTAETERKLEMKN